MLYSTSWDSLLLLRAGGGFTKELRRASSPCKMKVSIGETSISTFRSFSVHFPTASNLMRMDIDAPNISIHILSSSVTALQHGQQNLAWVLEATSKHAAGGDLARILFDDGDTANPRVYLLLQTRAAIDTATSLNDAVDDLGDFLSDHQRGGRSPILAMALRGSESMANGESEKETEWQGEASLLVVQSVKSLTDSVALTLSEERAIMERHASCGSLSRSAGWKSRIWDMLSRHRLLSTAALIFIITLTTVCILGLLIGHSSLRHMWRAITHPEAVRGPARQLEYTQFNVTTWSLTHPHFETDFFVRYDDQALIPVSLLTDEEVSYQKWFETRYPAQAQLVKTRIYMNETWLASGENQVEADNQFHRAHCALTLRRYWIAKESGRHICKWDLEQDHIRHCLNTIDKYIFTEGPLDEQDKATLTWNTKVCY